MSSLRLAAFVTLLLLALGPRVWELSRRPMHADEANQALKTGRLLEDGAYAFDPRDHHGPTLYYAALPLAWVRGERTLAELSETTLRLGPALWGVAAVLLLAVLGPVEAYGARWLAAAFLALSPPAVYYARCYIQETLLLAFTLLAVALAQRWWRTGRAAWAAGAGGALGLMLATKESALLLVAALVVAGVAARPARPAAQRPGRDVLLALVCAAAVAAAFYSSFGGNPAGLRDALLAPWLGGQRAVGMTGHEKPWWYYLQLLTTAASGGPGWGQTVLLLLALLGAARGWVERSAWLRGNAVYAFVLLLVLSVVPYKTPWNLVSVLPALAVLAAGGIAGITRRRGGALVARVLAALALVTLAVDAWRVAIQRPADSRNPWAYVQSGFDVLKVRSWGIVARAAAPDEPIRVIAPEYWPVPWYLRGVPRVGYWNAPPAACDGAVVLVAAEQADVVRARLHGRYRERFIGLRPGVLLVAFVRAP
ncbi:flippase activity-associated protein Agl23 [Opitutus sp. ER46]|uniref:flippase activity-associated protein Agl23 n=1 Tax=Opitutus sp. ER46 TaxID=2161864 RepID=UPI000D2FF6C6|nr:flippase activity-associated protein Agl23 [Opitutus sp. ER46]PTX95609.1 hypothetical protein DB354_09335 [Opitutus sp. ER46]